MAKRIGVMVARMQAPAPTKAHHHLIQEVQLLSDVAVLVLGQAPVRLVPRDPMPASLRKRMVQEHYGSNIEYLILNDFPESDAVWSQNLDELLERYYPEDEVTLYGARDSFLPYYTGKYPTMTLWIDNCEGVSASDVRESIYEGRYRIKDNESYNAGFIAASVNPYPTSYQAVDAATLVLRHGIVSDYYILLGLKPGRTKWCLPGGFVDPDKDLDDTGLMLEGAAARELEEETGIKVPVASFKYCGSFRMDNPRYRRTPHKIGTAIFTVQVTDEQVLKAIPSDDLSKGLQLFRLRDLDMDTVLPEHHILVNHLKKLYTL